MSRLARLIPALALVPVLSSCGSVECSSLECSSTAVVDYGDVIVNEPYSLTINPSGQTVSVICLDSGPDTEPLPEWLECDANGFEITGEQADRTTISVAVVPLSTQEAVIANALVPLIVDEVLEPNGPDCEPACYRRTGSVAGN